MPDQDDLTPSQPDPCPDEKSRGGAPLGNTNALKHGFYSRRFHGGESKNLDDLPDELSMMEQLKMIQEIFRRAFDTLDENGGSHEAMLKSLSVFCQAAACKSRMVNTQVAVSAKSKSPFEAAHAEAINRINAEFDAMEAGKPAPENGAIANLPDYPRIPNWGNP